MKPTSQIENPQATQACGENPIRIPNESGPSSAWVIIPPEYHQRIQVVGAPEILQKEGISDIKGRVNKRVILLFVDINVPGKAKCHIFLRQYTCWF